MLFTKQEFFIFFGVLLATIVYSTVLVQAGLVNDSIVLYETTNETESNLVDEVESDTDTNINYDSILSGFDTLTSLYESAWNFFFGDTIIDDLSKFVFNFAYLIYAYPINVINLYSSLYAIGITPTFGYILFIPQILLTLTLIGGILKIINVVWIG